MSYILYNVDNRTFHTNSQERPTYYGYDFVFIAGIGIGLLIYKTFFLPASLQQLQQQQLQLQQEEQKKQQEEEDKRQQQLQQPQQQQQQQQQQPPQEEQQKQQHREDSMNQYLKGALVLGIFALGVFVGREPTKQSQPAAQPDANVITEKVNALQPATNANNPAGNAAPKEPVTNPVNNTNENGKTEETYYDANNQEVGRNAN